MPFELFLLDSSGGSSRSSCFVRLREETEEVERLTTGRRGADSELGESGDFEVLVEPDGALRLPDRRVSLGESGGGPIVATWAMYGGKDKESEGEGARPASWQIANGTKGFLTSLGLAQAHIPQCSFISSLSHPSSHLFPLHPTHYPQPSPNL